MKKFIAILLAAVLALSLFAMSGCDEFLSSTEEDTETIDVDSEELAIAKEKAEFEGLEYNVPDGFVLYEEESTDDDQMYCLEDYINGESDDYSFIEVIREECDEFTSTYDTGSFILYTEDVIRQQYENNDELENVQILKFEKTKIGGFEAVQYEASYEYMGIVITENIFEVYAGYDYITYFLAQYDTTEHTDAFEDSIEDIEALGL